MKDINQQEADAKSPEDGESGSEKSFHTHSEADQSDESHNNEDINAVILSGIDQKLTSLNQQRKAERMSQFCSAAVGGEIDKL